MVSVCPCIVPLTTVTVASEAYSAVQVTSPFTGISYSFVVATLSPLTQRTKRSPGLSSATIVTLLPKAKSFTLSSVSLNVPLTSVTVA